MPPPFVRPFHFWCQKVLPLVFDDSLSYYEVLAKMRDYLNSAIEEINGIGSEFEGVKTQLTQLRTYVDEYFARLDVNQAISDKLDNMVESGEMDAVITPIFAAYANPLFAASVADMVATNFAYANYENNKIYTFNQSTGLYQTTGKEFSGVVSSVDEMEDNDKYYALDSDGMLYSYDFPQAKFVATGLTYGGYRYGVNAMRPISNVYVLTTDSHVYTWNGTEYVDSGVVYGLNNTAFIWRRKLSSADNITLLITDGWYYFKNDSLPIGLPVNMKTSDGLAVVYSIPNDTGDSRNKRIILNTTLGGAWLWNGNEWISQTFSGYKTCENCGEINWNSVLYCDSDTVNKPNGENNGSLITFVDGNRFSQMFFGENVYFRINIIDEWIRLSTHEEYLTLTEKLHTLEYEQSSLSQAVEYNASNLMLAILSVQNQNTQLQELLTRNADFLLIANDYSIIQDENGRDLLTVAIVTNTDKSLTEENIPADAYTTGVAIEANANALQSLATALNSATQFVDNRFNEVNSRVSNIESAFMTITNFSILAENGLLLLCENASELCAEIYVQRTDSTLSEEHIPADAKATGEAIQLNRSEIVSVNENVITSKTEIAKLQTQLNETESLLTSVKPAQLCSESHLSIVGENNNALLAEIRVSTTDATLTMENVAADALAVGKAISAIKSNAIDYSNYITNSTNFSVPVIHLSGTLPLTKTNVTVQCKIMNGTTILYNDTAKLKVQGDSSIANPEKNYTLKLNNPITLFGYEINKWNLKCNYIDPSQCRNITGARTWRRCIDVIYPNTTNYTLSTSNADITTENGATIIGRTQHNMPIQKSPHNGTTDGEIVCLTHNGEFHGVYTMQISKSAYMFGMDLSQSQFVVSIEGWRYTHLNSVSDMKQVIEIEEASEDMTDEIILSSLNRIADALSNSTPENFVENISSIMDYNTVKAYICLVAFLQHYDGLSKNILLYSYDGGNTMGISAWDMDTTLGYMPGGLNLGVPGYSLSTINSLVANEEDGTNAINYSCLYRIKLNKLLNAALTMDSDGVKAMWNTLTSTVLQPQLLFYDFMCIQTKANITLFDLDFRKWNKKSKTVSFNAENAALACELNFIKANADFNAL